jgi:hypothetical protein
VSKVVILLTSRPCDSWICRNVAMMTYAALVTRSFGAKRTNLSRDALSLSKRMTASDFFGRYPQLHAVLRKELEYSSREHLNDLPVSVVSATMPEYLADNTTLQTSDLHSSLFSVLMLLSLLQTTNRINASDESPSDSFVPIVRACAKSRVWKVSGNSAPRDGTRLSGRSLRSVMQLEMLLLDSFHRRKSRLSAMRSWRTLKHFARTR